jgi:membrane fusion protein (multidrug efflux system)
VAIIKGVVAGETVVTAGQLKLRNGSPVLLNNSVQPADNPNPQVPNS